MKIAVIGSRDLTNKGFVERETDEFLRFMHDTYGGSINLTFLYGGSKGAASIAIDEVTRNGHDSVLFKPWHMIDRKIPFSTNLFFMRNKQMIDNSDRVIVFRNQEKDAEVDRALSYAKKMGKHVYEVVFESRDDITEAATA